MRIELRAFAAARAGRRLTAPLDATLDAGGALVLAGPNGAGKTTLLRALAGLLAPGGGRLLWDGADALDDRPAHARRVALLGHADAVKPLLTPRENLRTFARIRGLPSLTRERAIEAALDDAALGPLADFPAVMLSAGQRRRLALARTFLADAPLLLLDEPANALDAASVERLGARLARHRAAGGAVITSSHGPLPLADAAVLVLRRPG